MNRAISTFIGASISTINNIIKRYKETGSIEDRYRPGRPRISSPRDDRELVRIVSKNRRLSSQNLSHLWKLSNEKTAPSSTVRKRLQEQGYDWKAAAKKPKLS